MGVDDMPCATDAAVPLTTIHQPKYRQGQIACEMLLDMIDGAAARRETPDPCLVIRESTGEL